MVRNVFGTRLELCGTDPLTGFFRNGLCETDSQDLGVHTVCVVATEAFLDYSRRTGNDLSTPRPEFGFPGVKVGDRWCVCASRWKEAWEAGMAPPVVLTATHEATLNYLSLQELVKFGYKETRSDDASDHSARRGNGSG